MGYGTPLVVLVPLTPPVLLRTATNNPSAAAVFCGFCATPARDAGWGNGGGNRKPKKKGAAAADRPAPALGRCLHTNPSSTFSPSGQQRQIEARLHGGRVAPGSGGWGEGTAAAEEEEEEAKAGRG